MIAASQPTAQRNWGSAERGARMWVGAAGRGDRHSLGALCPSVSMVSGAGDHNTGDTLRRDPAWETAFTLVAPAPAAPWTPSFPRVMEAAMTPRKDNFPEPNRRRRARLEVKNPDAAGIDVGAEAHWVCVPADRQANPVARFGTCTADLEAIASWLQQCGVTTVAMESTGGYWVPLYGLLETPGVQARLRDPRCKESAATIARALQGNWRQEHLFALQQAVALYEFYHQQITACDRAIEAHLRTFADQSGGQPLPQRRHRRRREPNEPRFDARARLYCVCGVDLTAIEGIEETTALVLLSEIGTDMSRWPSVKHFCSWLGLCPQHKISGGKILSRRIRRGASRAKRALRLGARSLHHSKSALGAFFRRIKARYGTAAAITAAAHKLARLVYSLLKHGAAYVAQEMTEYEAKYRERRLQVVTRQARELGFQLVPAPAAGG